MFKYINSFMVFVVVAAIIGVICFCYKKTRENFSADVGFLYTQEARTGTKIPITPYKRVPIHSLDWLIWSADVPTDWVFKVTAIGTGDNNCLFLRSPGKLNNLPAALGGLPAHDNYTAIFNSNTEVYIELVTVEDAELYIQNKYSHCIETANATYCGNEFTSVK